MRPNRLFEDIRENAQNRKGRIALILSALTIGILSLTVLAGILKGLEKRGEHLVSDLGANVISVALRSESPRGFSAEDLLSLQKGLDDAALVSGIYSEKVALNDFDQSLTSIATDENYQQIKQWPLASGRWIDSQNIQQGNAVCVLSITLAEKLELQLQQTLTVKNTPLTIVGMLAPGIASDSTLYIPRTLLPHWSTDHSRPENRMNEIHIQAKQIPWQIVQERALNVLTAHSALRGQLEWTTPATLTKDIKRLQTSLKWTAGSVALLCLLLGGATLMSLMTANVRERIPEIGLRLSLGAGPRDIYTLFLVEALCITLIASCLGTLGGHLLLEFGPLPEELPYATNMQTLLFPSTCSLIMALFFSWGPANMAAKINPADALRHE